jgi:hypothetical protein
MADYEIWKFEEDGKVKIIIGENRQRGNTNADQS